MSKIRSLVFTLTLTSVFLGVVPGFSMPEAEASWWQRIRDRVQQMIERRQEARNARNAKAVPELDPSAAGQAIILVAGGIYLVSRRRRPANR